jgi:hypothetical protein
MIEARLAIAWKDADAALKAPPAGELAQVR